MTKKRKEKWQVACEADARELATVAAKVAGLKHSQASGLAFLFKQFAEKWAHAIREELRPGPLDGELSIYRDGEWMMGISGPHVDAALDAIASVLERELPQAVDAVDPQGGNSNA